MVLFPGEVGVGQVARVAGAVAAVARVVVHGHVAEVVGRQGAGGTVGSADLTVAQPGGVLQEFLVGEAPRCADGPEVTPAGFRREFRAAVAAERAGQVIAGAVVVAHAAQGGEQGAQARVGVAVVEIRSQIRFGGSHVGKVDLVEAGVLEFLAFSLPGGHGGEMMFTPGLVEIQLRGAYQAVHIAVPVAHVAAHVAVGIEVRVAIEPAETVVHVEPVFADGRFETQEVGELDFGPALEDQTVLPGVVDLLVVGLDGVDGREAGAPALKIEVARIFIGVRPALVEDHFPDEERVVLGGVAVLVTGLVLPGELGGAAHLEPVVHIGFGVDGGGETLQVVDGDHALLVGPADRGIDLAFLAAAREAQLVVLGDTGAEEDVFPILIDILAFVLGRVVGGHLVVYIGLDAAVALPGRRVVLGVVGPGHPVQRFGFGIVRQRVVVIGEVGETGAGLEVGGQLPGLAFLGGDQDHTVGGAGTVEGSRGGVLQDGDGLDIARVEEVHRAGGDVSGGIVTTGGRYAVDDVERLVAGIEGAETTDGDVGLGTGLAGVGGYLYARRLAGEDLFKTYDRCILDGFLLDHGCRAGIGTLLDCTVSHDHRLFQGFPVGGEDDIDRRFSVPLDFLGQETDR